MAFLLPRSPLLFLHLLFIIHHSPGANSDPNPVIWVACSTEANYTASSPFKSNLNLLLPLLAASAAAAAGFSNETQGRSPDQVYGLALCRGDVVSPAECHDCLNSSIQDFAKTCPQGKSAALWYDKCMLRYSDQRFLSSANTSFRVFLVSGASASQPARFSQLLGQLMGSLISRAADDSARMFATGEVNYTSSLNLYGMAQCSRDLSGSECRRCLGDYFGYVQTCCDGREGARVFGLSCKVQYETHLFYNASVADDALSLTSPPASSPSAAADGLAFPSSNTTSGGKEQNTGTLVLVIVIPIAGVLVLLSVIYTCFKRRKTIRRKNNGHDSVIGDEITTSRTILFDLNALRKATNDFSEANKLGQGGFGPVYKGLLSEGQQIAVKRLSSISKQGIVELRNEVELVAKLQHKNLVTLLGFCLDQQEKLLVYEYLPNRSLDIFLFGNRSQQTEQFDWRTRYQIIEGIGRGLLYLHVDSRLKIIHRDLKASNILLDGDMKPKISDFGMARLFGVNETHRITTRLAGTYGYMAPEYVRYKKFSTSSDVFSYGVLILEIVTGRENSDFDGPDYAAGLLGHVWRHWNEERVLELVDQSVSEECQLDEVLRCIHIGLLCVQGDPAKRPSVASIVLMLSTHLVTAPSPSAPAFCEPEGVLSSVNHVSITEMQPR